MVGFRHAYGLPEHADSFSLKSTVGQTDPYRLFNLDVFEYVSSTHLQIPHKQKSVETIAQINFSNDLLT